MFTSQDFGPTSIFRCQIADVEPVLSFDLDICVPASEPIHRSIFKQPPSYVFSTNGGTMHVLCPRSVGAS